MKRKTIPTDWWKATWHKTLTATEQLLWRCAWENCVETGFFCQFDISSAMNTDSAAIGKALDEMVKAGVFYSYDPREGIYVIPNFMRVQYGLLSRKCRGQRDLWMQLDSLFPQGLEDGWVKAGFNKADLPAIKA